MSLIKRALNAITGKSESDSNRQISIEQEDALFTAVVENLQKMDFPITPEEEHIADKLDRE